MKKIFSLLVSPKTTLILLLVFSVSIAVATFVEDKYDTTTAQLVIYRAWWFEAIIALMALNFIGNIKRYNLLSRNRIGGLVFHIGFILLIIGAGVTRYFGFEGSMHIREGGSSNYIFSDKPSLQVSVNGPGGSFSETHKMRINLLGKNNYSFNIKSGSQSPVNVRFKQYLHNAVESVNENVPGGVDMISVQIRDGAFNQGVYLKKGEKINSGKITIAFGDTTSINDVLITEADNNLVAIAGEEITGLGMADGTVTDSLKSGNRVDFREKRIFSYKGVMFSLNRYYRKAEIVFNEVPDDGHNHGINVMVFDVTYKDQVQRAHLTNVASENGMGQELYFGDTKVYIKYAPQEIPVPFSLKLNKFILERYAGSKSPSSYASEVTVIDKEKNKTFDYRVFMNHVLDYRGYRFFQSSYDQDEKGTILSVNHDFWGTWISYISYLLLLIGFIITLLSKHTRFGVLSLAIRNIRTRRKSITLFIALTGSILAYTQGSGHTVNQQEAEKLGKILVQTYDGRIEPLHTLAFDVMHKISRKDKFSFSGKPEMDAMMVMIDMLVDQEYWKRQELIYVREKSVQQVIGITGKYASFNNFMNANGQYKLAQLIDESFHKDPATQNTFDKELIKVDERVNLFYMLLQGNIMKIYPVNMNSTQWVAWNDSLAFQPLKGTITKINDELQLQNFNYNGIMQAYLQALVTGSHSGNYFNADKILGYIRSIQKGNILSKNFPTSSRISAEVWYNKVNIFKRLKGYYALLSVFLLFFALLSNFRSQLPKWLVWAQKIFIGLLAVTFLFHSFGMALRWYLSGHAPWSDGYEALLLVSWSVVLAGFFFMRNSQIIQAATAFLASIILMTAGHSNYDPQLTNLQPVLKSYWLIVHVAVITISYGFLALGFILGIINMFLYLFKSPGKHVKSDLLINELTYVNEKNLQVGLFLATMGTFLGGVWANESWGRYWGWDAKETWALIIIIVYSIILHLRLVPKLQSGYLFNIGSIIGFGSVLMTFLGVNYYLSKGLHSYASGEKTVFPLWAWIVILSLAALMIVAGLKERKSKKVIIKGNNHKH